MVDKITVKNSNQIAVQLIGPTGETVQLQPNAVTKVDASFANGVIPNGVFLNVPDKKIPPGTVSTESSKTDQGAIKISKSAARTSNTP